MNKLRKHNTLQFLDFGEFKAEKHFDQTSELNTILKAQLFTTTLRIKKMRNEVLCAKLSEMLPHPGRQVQAFAKAVPTPTAIWIRGQPQRNWPQLKKLEPETETRNVEPGWKSGHRIGCKKQRYLPQYSLLRLLASQDLRV